MLKFAGTVRARLQPCRIVAAVSAGLTLRLEFIILAISLLCAGISPKIIPGTAMVKNACALDHED